MGTQSLLSLTQDHPQSRSSLVGSFASNQCVAGLLRLVSSAQSPSWAARRRTVRRRLARDRLRHLVCTARSRWSARWSVWVMKRCCSPTACMFRCMLGGQGRCRPVWSRRHRSRLLWSSSSCRRPAHRSHEGVSSRVRELPIAGCIKNVWRVSCSVECVSHDTYCSASRAAEHDDVVVAIVG